LLGLCFILFPEEFIALSDENIKNEILGFELNNITEN
jgi:hypothetical protein